MGDLEVFKNLPQSAGVTTMKLDANDMMDYLDGTLNESRRAQIDAHLANHAEDRELIATMRASMNALNQLDELEPVRASDDFWLKVRAGLPDKAPRRSWTTQVAGWLWPQTSRAALSMRVAVVAGVIALMGMWFAPQQSRQVSYALPQDAETFIKAATERHNAYVSTQPLTSAPVGDVSGKETGDEDDEAGGSTP